MSNRLLSAAWRLPLPATDKVVLAALADCADDDGVTWIAMRSRRDKLDLITMTSLSERAIQGAIKRLCAAGHLKRDEVAGRGVTYIVHPRSTCTPAGDAPPQHVRPAGDAPTPAEAAGKPPVTPISTKASPSPRTRAAQPARNAVQSMPDLPAGASTEQWEAFVAMRRQMKKPLGPHAAKLAITKLIELAGDGHDPGKVLDQSTMRGWQGLFPIKGDDDGQRRGTAGRSAWAEHHPGGRTGLAADRVFGGLDGDRPM